MAPPKLGKVNKINKTEHNDQTVNKTSKTEEHTSPSKSSKFVLGKGSYMLSPTKIVSNQLVSIDVFIVARNNNYDTDTVSTTHYLIYDIASNSCGMLFVPQAGQTALQQVINSKSYYVKLNNVNKTGQGNTKMNSKFNNSYEWDNNSSITTIDGNADEIKIKASQCFAQISLDTLKNIISDNNTQASPAAYRLVLHTYSKKPTELNYSPAQQVVLYDQLNNVSIKLSTWSKYDIPLQQPAMLLGIKKGYKPAWSNSTTLSSARDTFIAFGNDNIYIDLPPGLTVTKPPSSLYHYNNAWLDKITTIDELFNSIRGKVLGISAAGVVVLKLAGVDFTSQPIAYNACGQRAQRNNSNLRPCHKKTTAKEDVEDSFSCEYGHVITSEQVSVRYKFRLNNVQDLKQNNNTDRYTIDVFQEAGIELLGSDYPTLHSKFAENDVLINEFAATFYDLVIIGVVSVKQRDTYNGVSPEIILSGVYPSYQPAGMEEEQSENEEETKENES